jgi:hypothetical protein
MLDRKGLCASFMGSSDPNAMVTPNVSHVHCGVLSPLIKGLVSASDSIARCAAGCCGGKVCLRVPLHCAPSLGL